VKTAILAFLIFGVLISSSLLKPQNTKPASAEGGTAKLPSYYVYKMKTGEGIISVVVPPQTTDEELKRLVWYFREKVRAGRFREIGINKPSNINRAGKLDYGGGIIGIYRGAKCANEQFIDTNGPCGYGEHDSAVYQWGIEGDPQKDSGGITTREGAFVAIFGNK
jgi:hypothetical protein